VAEREARAAGGGGRAAADRRGAGLLARATGAGVVREEPAREHRDNGGDVGAAGGGGARPGGVGRWICLCFITELARLRNTHPPTHPPNHPSIPLSIMPVPHLPSPQKVRENFKALDVMPKLTPDLLAQIDAVINAASASNA